MKKTMLTILVFLLIITTVSAQQNSCLVASEENVPQAAQRILKK